MTSTYHSESTIQSKHQLREGIMYTHIHIYACMYVHITRSTDKPLTQLQQTEI